jgi:hypothetical protein
VSRNDIKVTAIKPYGITEALDIKGQQHVSFILDGRKFNHTFLVCLLPTDADVLSGIDFLDKPATKINFDSGKLSVADDNKVPYACDTVSTKHGALTVFLKTNWRMISPSRCEVRNRALVSTVWTTLLRTRQHTAANRGLSR